MESNSLWTRRSNSGKLSLSMSSSAHNSSNNNTTGDTPSSSKIFGPPSAKLTSSHKPSYENPFAKLHNINTGNPALPSPTANATKSASAAFNLGIGGAFGSFGLKTPKTPSGDGLNATGSVSTGAIATPSLPKGLTASEVVAGTKKSNNNAAVNQQDSHPLKNVWVVWYRSPGNKFQDYEKSTQKIAYFGTVEEFWCVYGHLRRPNVLPHVSDYHLFKKGIRPVWEDKENRRGGKWNIRLKKGVSTRYWEELLLAIVGDQFGDAGEDLCGAVLSIRGNEDVLSVWTRVDGSSCLKIKETVKRKLNLPQGTRIEWKSHASSLEAVNQKSQSQNQNQGQNQGQVPPQ